jgi:ubiquinone/menaquinone biosynthesis C-methylase UbiE
MAAANMPSRLFAAPSRRLRPGEEISMLDKVQAHYGSTAGLAATIAERLRAAGKQPGQITTADLASVDEFHIRGRKATLELASRMELGSGSRVLDLGSGLGGPARTLAEVYGCSVTGIDLTPEFCTAAQELSRWVGLADKVSFSQGDATALPYAPATFDAAMTIHVAMNIAAKDALYAAAHRALKTGRIFAVYDVLKGDGGEVLFPVPWARDPATSHLATPAQMRELLQGSGFRILDEIDSSEESGAWFKEAAARMSPAQVPPLSFRTFLGDDFAHMTRNQVRNLTEGRIKTVAYICRS